ncbi:hypothetical protein LTS08_007645 [Lithohypha guttulata]|nr:hypothetical protein LTS08_007645 [Lithohypha guttulata]
MNCDLTKSGKRFTTQPVTMGHWSYGIAYLLLPEEVKKFEELRMKMKALKAKATAANTAEEATSESTGAAEIVTPPENQAEETGQAESSGDSPEEASKTEEGKVVKDVATEAEKEKADDDGDKDASTPAH